MRSSATGELAVDAAPRGVLQALGLSVAVCGERVDAGHDVRLLHRRGGLKIAPVDVDSFLQGLRRKVRGKRVGQAQARGQLSAKQRRPKDIERYVGAMPRNGAYAGNGTLITEQAAQLKHVLREPLCRVRRASECIKRGGVTTRCTTQSQIDPTGVQLSQGTKLLGNGER